MKKFFLLFLTVLALFCVAACQEPANQPNESSSPAASDGGFELPEDKFD